MKNRELLDLKKKELQKENDEINNESEENVNKAKNLKSLNKEIKKIDEIIDQIQGNISLRSDVDKMKAVCKNIKIDVKKIVKQKIIEDCNYELKKFTGNKLLQIEDIEEYITLQNQSSGSEGQKLSVGMLYLSVLLARENVNFLHYLIFIWKN